jgi:hypothetical protein
LGTGAVGDGALKIIVIFLNFNILFFNLFIILWIHNILL